nr:amidohydrolase family protein [Sphingomonas quercus]
MSAGASQTDAAGVWDDVPIIDAHIHLFDGTRPQGAPYVGSPAYAAISKVSLPSGYRPLARPAGIVGAVVVETSPWIEDNLWLLETAQSDPMIVAVSGYLDPFKADFGEYLDRFRKNRLYRAIRYSRFYTDDGGRIALAPAAIDNMRRLAAADLALDTANPSMGLLRANALLAEAVPDLRVIVDHLPSFDPTPDNQAAYDAVIRDLAALPNVFVKLSQVYHRRRDHQIITEFAQLRERLDNLFAAFGEDRLMFGSDYPNSYGTATIAETVALMRRFYAGKSRTAAEKYFWRNAARVYKWTRRAPDQPMPG